MTPFEITAVGAPFERGRAFGAALSGKIRQFVGDDLARINTLRRQPLSDEKARRAAFAYAEAVQRWLPDVFEEMRGLSSGADIEEWQAALLQVRRELIAEDGGSGDCSLLAATAPRFGGLLAQTIDLNGDLTDFGCVLRIVPDESREPRQLLYTFAGLLGYLGVNSAGLAVGINMVIAEGWRVGVPPYLLVRKLLSLSSIEACLEALRTIPRSSSRTLTLCDGRRVVTVEMTVRDLRVITGECLLHTNHYLHEELVPADRSHVLSRRSSKRRLQRLQSLVHGAEQPVSAAQVFSWLSDHDGQGSAICSHGTGDPRRSETVAAVLIYPREGVLCVRQGPPCRVRESAFVV